MKRYITSHMYSKIAIKDKVAIFLQGSDQKLEELSQKNKALLQDKIEEEEEIWRNIYFS